MRAFGGWSPFSYLIVFVAGFLIASDLSYRETIKRLRFVSLSLGFLTTILMFFLPIDLTPLGDFTEYTVPIFLRSFNSWLWLMAILGLGSKYLNFDNKVLTYTRAAVLPFYILHQTVIVIIGFYIANWDTSIMIKYLTLSTLSFAVIIMIYELLIKRVNLIRFLFGIKYVK